MSKMKFQLNNIWGFALTAGLFCSGCSEELSIEQKDVGEEKKALTSQMVINAIDGVANSKQLTIQPVLQREVTSILKRHADTNYTGRGWAVVLSVSNGAVLAMADCGAGDAQSRPLAVKKFFDPGHTVSPFAVAAAFNDGVVTPDSKISTCEDRDKYPYIIGDDKIFGVTEFAVKDALPRSVNSVIKKIGQDLGDNVYSALTSFGLSKNAIIDFDVFDVNGVGGVNLSKMQGSKKMQSVVSVGQGFEVSALQLARAYAIIANRGCWVDPSFECVEKPAGKQIISADVAEKLVKILLVKEKSTGRKAAVSDVDVAGKTGTAQIKDDIGQYETDCFTAIFAGFFPVEKPSHVVVVCYETRRNASRNYFGGDRPAEAFAEIAEFCISHKDK